MRAVNWLWEAINIGTFFFAREKIENRKKKVERKIWEICLSNRKCNTSAGVLHNLKRGNSGK